MDLSGGSRSPVPAHDLTLVVDPATPSSETTQKGSWHVRGHIDRRIDARIKHKAVYTSRTRCRTIRANDHSFYVNVVGKVKAINRARRVNQGEHPLGTPPVRMAHASFSINTVLSHADPQVIDSVVLGIHRAGERGIECCKGKGGTWGRSKSARSSS